MKALKLWIYELVQDTAVFAGAYGLAKYKGEDHVMLVGVHGNEQDADADRAHLARGCPGVGKIAANAELASLNAEEDEEGPE